MDFMKMQGAGNDFIVIEGPFAPEPDDVVAWCERRTGIGSDGVLVATRLSPGRVSVRERSAVRRTFRLRSWVGRFARVHR